VAAGWFTPCKSFLRPCRLHYSQDYEHGRGNTGIGAVMHRRFTASRRQATIGFICQRHGGRHDVDGPTRGGSLWLMGVLMFALGTVGSAIVGAAHDSSGRAMGGRYICDLGLCRPSAAVGLRRQPSG